MEQHLAGNRRIEDACQYMSALGIECDQVYFFVAYKLLDRKQQITVGQNRMRNIGIGIMLFQVLMDAGEPDFVPFILLVETLNR